MNKTKLVLTALAVFLFTLSACDKMNKEIESPLTDFTKMVIETDEDWILSDAEVYLQEKPITVTAATCDRSLGGKNDFYSEGDYWWPNPDDPDGPYVNRDGMSNPDNFLDHRKSMRRMSIHVATLAAAYKISGEEKYAAKAVEHLKAWFVNPESMMKPNMEYSQAIKGIVPGRGVGLIDGIHLVEPARAVSVLGESKSFDDKDYKTVVKWYAEFLEWMTTHEYGIDERDRTNNHGTCWVMQAGEYARLTGNGEITEYCRERFKTVLLPNQMSLNGSYHMELKRTKPYGYSLFNMDAMGMVCHILSIEDDIWNFTLPDGRGMKIGLEYITPYIADKAIWPLPPDVMYWDEWPARHPTLLFGGIAYDKMDYIELWKKMVPVPATEEGLRNFPIRQPILWLN